MHTSYIRKQEEMLLFIYRSDIIKILENHFLNTAFLTLDSKARLSIVLSFLAKVNDFPVSVA